MLKLIKDINLYAKLLKKNLNILFILLKMKCVNFNSKDIAVKQLIMN